MPNSCANSNSNSLVKWLVFGRIPFDLKYNTRFFFCCHEVDVIRWCVGSWNRKLNAGDSGVNRFNDDQHCGFSVRCLKDTEEWKSCWSYCWRCVGVEPQCAKWNLKSRLGWWWQYWCIRPPCPFECIFIKRCRWWRHRGLDGRLCRCTMPVWYAAPIKGMFP